jgi:hypothetical protein
MDPSSVGRDFAMRRSTLLVLTAALTAALTTVVTAASAGAHHSDVVAVWDLDEPPGSTVLHDSGGHGHHGRISPGVLVGVPAPVGIVHRFSGSSAPGDGHVVPSHPALEPGRGDYGVSLHLRTTRSSFNVVQKGQSGASGGMVKLEVEDGRFRCLFRGSGVSTGLASPFRIDDGEWHTVRCQRHRGEVVLAVDHVVVGRRPDRSGTIVNGWEVAIGAKSRCNQVTVGCDPFSGDLNWVRIDQGIPK